MRDKVGASDQIGFVLNGKPIIPRQPIQPDTQEPETPNADDEDSINIE